MAALFDDTEESENVHGPMSDDEDGDSSDESNDGMSDVEDGSIDEESEERQDEVISNPEPERWDLPFILPMRQFDPQPEKINPEFGVSIVSTRFEILRKFITDDAINNIIIESERYKNEIQQVHPKSFQGWKQFDIPEFWRFTAIGLLMGLVKKSSLKDYWTTDPLLQTPAFGDIMSRQRYLDMQRSLHFVDNKSVHPTNTDRFVKLGDFLPNLLQKFRSAIIPGEFLCLDETLLAFKGRLSIIQYNPKKRARFGIKMFVLVDNSTGVVVDILPYQGKSTKILNRQWIKELGFGGATVMTLLDRYLDTGHKIVIDNWFNSPNLALKLYDRNTYVVGTVQKKRKNMPKTARMKKKLPKGEIEVFSNGSILIERWNDRREVVMLNSFMDHEMQMSRARNPANTRLKPATVLLYNTTMGGVDNVDRQITPYQSSRKTYKWYKKAYTRLNDIAIHNTYKIYWSLRFSTREPYKDFLHELIKEILMTFPTQKASRGRPSNAIPDARFTGLHIPIRMLKNDGKASKQDCVYCRRSGRRVQTQFKCKNCGVRLCIQEEPNCFELYHTKRHLPKTKRQNTMIEGNHDEEELQMEVEFLDDLESENANASPQPPVNSQVVPTLDSDAIFEEEFEMSFI